MSSGLALLAQPVDATQALNLSAGVSNCKVSRGRSLSCLATLFRCACECPDKSVPFGKYCLSRPLVFSLEPRCHGLCGSQKYTSILVASVNRRLSASSLPRSQVRDLYSSVGSSFDCLMSADTTVCV